MQKDKDLNGDVPRDDFTWRKYLGELKTSSGDWEMSLVFYNRPTDFCEGLWFITDLLNGMCADKGSSAYRIVDEYGNLYWEGAAKPEEAVCP